MTAGAGSATIAAEIEHAVASGELAAGDRLPAVRALASDLGVSPATVAAAYRTLKQRGLVSANGRHGTTVAAQPPLGVRPRRVLPPNARDLASGNPDRALLPPLDGALARIDRSHKLYGGRTKLPQLVELATADFAADGIRGEIGITAGALDGIERALQSQLRPSDRVAVEDPSWPRIGDLVRALGLQLEPVLIDERGLLPDQLAVALERGARAVIATPRGQNPTGAALDTSRAHALRQVLAAQPEVLVIEDDYLAAVAGAPYFSIHDASARWIVIRSLSKLLGPDLRIATLAGDALTVSRIEGRQLVGPGWVSHLLQQIAAELWSAPSTHRLLTRAKRLYAQRREALVDALAQVGLSAHGDTGFGVWVPLAEEAEAAQFLLERGWAVSPGERFRFNAPSGLRITTTDLQPREAEQLAAILHELARGAGSTYSG
jgi:DNA-binding transcriptional MocR family regulator